MTRIDKTTYLILGNSTAAVNAVEAIRERDREGSMVVVAREPQHVYSRPLISYRLAGKVDDARMDYRDRAFYERNNVQPLLGVAAVNVDAEARAVSLSDGRRIEFEKLLIATGGAPIRPPIPGLDARGVFTFTTWADEQAIDKYIEANKVRAAVVLGGGLIGLKTVEALVDRDVPVTVVELADRILAVTFDKDAARLAEKALAEKGVGIRTGETIREVFADGGKVSAVLLSNGEGLDCDLLIVAIGVRPDLSVVAGSGIKTDRGILVDTHMATSVDGIYAAGDVAQALDALSGQSRPIPILPAAARQGRIVGANMAGGDATYEGGVPMNAVDVVGLPTISVGQTVQQEGDEVLARLDEKNRTYRKLVIRGNRIIGAIFIGRIERAGIFTGLIRSRLDVSDFKHLLLSDEFGLLSLPADYRSHMVRGAGIEV
ncbi:MAG: NAD(P)/FAD-dependent oxidoreductase [Phycisphaerae bacterium]